MKPDGSNVEVKVLRILNEDGEEQGKCTAFKADPAHIELERDRAGSI